MYFQSCLTDLAAVSSRFKDVLDFGFSQLHSTAIKPRIKPWVDTFLSTSHNISDVSFKVQPVHNVCEGIVLALNVNSSL